MARLNYKCDDCGGSFDLQYLFIKPDKVKCPSCGSNKVRQETKEGSQCGCGGQGRNSGGFT